MRWAVDLVNRFGWEEPGLEVCHPAFQASQSMGDGFPFRGRQPVYESVDRSYTLCGEIQRLAGTELVVYATFSESEVEESPDQIQFALQEVRAETGSFCDGLKNIFLHHTSMLRKSYYIEVVFLISEDRH